MVLRRRLPHRADRARGRPDCSLHFWLAGLGIGAVVVRPTLWLPDERAQVLGHLVQGFGPPVANTLDAGEWVLVFKVGGDAAGRESATSAWRRWSGA